MMIRRIIPQAYVAVVQVMSMGIKAQDPLSK